MEQEYICDSQSSHLRSDLEQHDIQTSIDDKVHLYLIEDLQTERQSTLKFQNIKIKLLEQINSLETNIDLEQQSINNNKHQKLKRGNLQTKIQLLEALTYEDNNRDKLSYEVKKMELQKSQILLKLKRNNQNVEKIQSKFSELYPQILQTENKISKLKEASANQLRQNQRTSNQNRKIQNMIDNHILSQVLKNQQNPEEFLKNFSNYNELIIYFIEKTHYAHRQISRLQEFSVPTMEAIQQQLKTVKIQTQMVQSRNEKLKKSNDNLDSLHSSMLEKYYNLQSSYRSHLNQQKNKKVQEQNNLLNLKIEREDRIINSLMELIRLKGSNFYNSAIQLVETLKRHSR